MTFSECETKYEVIYIFCRLKYFYELWKVLFAFIKRWHWNIAFEWSFFPVYIYLSFLNKITVY